MYVVTPHSNDFDYHTIAGQSKLISMAGVLTASKWIEADSVSTWDPSPHNQCFTRALPYLTVLDRTRTDSDLRPPYLLQLLLVAQVNDWYPMFREWIHDCGVSETFDAGPLSGTTCTKRDCIINSTYFGIRNVYPCVNLSTPLGHVAWPESTALGATCHALLTLSPLVACVPQLLRPRQGAARRGRQQHRRRVWHGR